MSEQLLRENLAEQKKTNELLQVIVSNQEQNEIIHSPKSSDPYFYKVILDSLEKSNQEGFEISSISHGPFNGSPNRELIVSMFNPLSESESTLPLKK